MIRLLDDCIYPILKNNQSQRTLHKNILLYIYWAVVFIHPLQNKTKWNDFLIFFLKKTNK
jgi:hypothetical protein